MPPDMHDAACLWDMLRAPREAVEFVRGLDRQTYLQDRLRQAAMERCLEIIGEAARKVSPPCRAEHPEIPWRRIVGQRHVLAHEYGRIDHARLWDVVTVHVPALVAALEPLVPPPNDL